MQKQIDYQELANADVSAGLSHTNVHDHLKQNSVEVNRALTVDDRAPFGVCVLNITGELNVGTVVRTAHLTGASKVGIIGRKKYDSRGEVGSSKYFDVERISGLNDDGLTINPDVFWDWIDTNRFSPIFVEQGGTLLKDVNWELRCRDMRMLSQRPCLVFGNENRGIQDDILHDSRGTIVSLSQCGVIRSYNVASTAAIVMYHLTSYMGWF